MISVETFPLNSETLYIYRGVNILCLRHRHPVIEVLAVLPTMKGDAVMQEVKYCEDCRCAFLNDLQYRRMMHRYSILPVRMARVAHTGRFTDRFVRARTRHRNLRWRCAAIRFARGRE